MYNNFFEKIDTEEKAYWLGFIAADGNICKSNCAVKIELKASDYHHLEKFNQCLDNEWKVTLHDRDFPSAIISIYSIKCQQDLIQYGITPAKSLTLDLCWNKIPTHLIRHVVRGYFDGDGSIYCSHPKRKNGYNYDEWGMNFVGSKPMVQYIKHFLGVKNPVHKKGNIFEIDIGGTLSTYESMLKFYENAAIYLDRKKEKFDELRSSQRLSNLVSKRDYNAENKNPSLIVGYILGGASFQNNKLRKTTLDEKLMNHIKSIFDENGFITKLASCPKGFLLNIEIPALQANNYKHKIFPNKNRTISREILNELGLDGLAIWLACKGKTKNGGIELNTSVYSQEENEIIKKYFETTFKIKPTFHSRKGRIYLYIAAKDSKIFIDKGCAPRDTLRLSR